MLLCEFFRALADEVDVRTLIENEARGLNGIAQALDAGHASGAHGASVHEQGVELHAAIAGEEAAASGIEGVVVFEDGNGGLDCVYSRCTFVELCVSGTESVGDAALMRFDHVVRDGPGSAVNQKYGCVWHTRLLIVSCRNRDAPLRARAAHLVELLLFSLRLRLLCRPAPESRRFPSRGCSALLQRSPEILRRRRGLSVALRG